MRLHGAMCLALAGRAAAFGSAATTAARRSGHRRPRLSAVEDRASPDAVQAKVQAAVQAAAAPAAQSRPRSSLVTTALDRRQRPFWAHVTKVVLRRAVLARARSAIGLRVDVDALSNRNALRGKMDEITMEFEQVFFDRVQVSGGGRMRILGLDVSVFSAFTSLFSKWRLRRPFDVQLECTLNAVDVANSAALRRLMQLLVNTVLMNGLPDVLGDSFAVGAVETIALKSDGRLVLRGKVTSAVSLAPQPFAVVADLNTRRGGHILEMRRTDLLLNPGEPNELLIPIPPSASLDVDIGDNACIERLSIGSDTIDLAIRSTIFPAKPFLVHTAEKHALFNVDFSSFLSALAGVARPDDEEVES